MKSEMTKEETEKLLDDADTERPDSDFVASVRDWFEEHGWITDNQESALNDVVNNER